MDFARKRKKSRFLYIDNTIFPLLVALASLGSGTQIELVLFGVLLLKVAKESGAVAVVCHWHKHFHLDVCYKPNKV
jgi:hypothetical protein